MRFAPHAFSLRQLQYMVAVAEELSFRRAAERCRVSQPALSGQLAHLEDVLGVRLFERDRRRVRPTTAGAELLALAARILVEVDDLEAAAKRVGDPFVGTVRVGVIPTVSPYLLPAVTARLRARFPRLVVAWVEDKTETLLARLDAGELDAALLASGGAHEELERALIAEDPFVLATPLGHALAKRATPAALSELRGAEVLLLDDGHCFREQALALCARAHAHELQFRATSLSTLVQMVAGGAGVTLLPALALATERRRAKLAIRRLAAPAPKRELSLVWRRGAARSLLQAVAAVLREAYPTPKLAR